MKINEVTNKKLEPSKPRNFVAKNMTTGGAGAHKDKKKAEKQGDFKHKKQAVPMDESDGSENYGDYQQMIRKIENAMWQLHQHGRSVEEIGNLAHKIADHLRIDMDNDDMFAHAFHKAYNNFVDEVSQDDEFELEETGEITGTVAAVSSDGKQVTVKNADGSETQTSSDAFVPGPNNTVTMKHDAAGDALKPGAAVTSDQQVSEEGDDDDNQVFALAPDEEHIHQELDTDLIGSGHNHYIGGDATDQYIDQVRDKDFERAQRPGREGLAGREKRLSENDELAKMLTIAGLR